MIFEPANLLVISAAITFAGVLVAVLLIWIATRNNTPGRSVRAFEEKTALLEQAISRLNATQSELAGRLTSLADSTSAGQTNLTRMVEERLDEVTHRMSSSLHETANKTAETLGTLNTRLSVIDEAQKQIVDLSKEVISLQDILENKQARGAFGEIQLSDLIKDVLPPSAYQFQSTLSNGKRADCIVRLPNPPGPIAIDAKFPLEPFTRLGEAQTEADYASAEREFRNTVMNHVIDIAQKYIVPGETADSALMFLPSEGVYAALHTEFLDVVEKAYRAKVWIVSPTTMMATLNTIRAVMKDTVMRDHADVIQKEVTLMLDDVTRLKSRVGKLQTHFTQAEKDIRDIITSTDKISRRGENIEQMKIDGAGIDGAPALPMTPRIPSTPSAPDGPLDGNDPKANGRGPLSGKIEPVAV